MNSEYAAHLQGYLDELINEPEELSEGEKKLMGLLQSLVEDWDRRRPEAIPGV